MKTVLVCVVSGSIYEKFAEDLFSSAHEYFHPTDQVECLMLEGSFGWPAATMYRHHHLHKHMPDCDFVFLSDADMLFEDYVGDEILTPSLTATLHPGYVGKPRIELPYERRPGLWTRVPPTRGGVYYCGGFIGGTRKAMLAFTSLVIRDIDHDVALGYTPYWHDESALNNLLAFKAPDNVLPPSYCYPDNDGYYKSIWKDEYDRILVARDKTEAERGDR